MLLICIPFAILLVIYCFLEKKELFLPATALKVALSAYAAAVAVFSAVRLEDTVYYIFALGLVCAVPADYFLQYIKLNLPRYRFGIFFFGAMHVCLLVSFYLKYPVTGYEFIICGVFLLILFIFQKTGKWKMGAEKAQLSVYTVLVTFMAAKAISLYIAAPSRFTLAAALGGAFFFLSDLFLGIWGYSREKFVFLALNRVIYFSGQLCLAFYLFLMT